jgi:hypothetical protein
MLPDIAFRTCFPSRLISMSYSLIFFTRNYNGVGILAFFAVTEKDDAAIQDSSVENHNEPVADHAVNDYLVKTLFIADTKSKDINNIYTFPESHSEKFVLTNSDKSWFSFCWYSSNEILCLKKGQILSIDLSLKKVEKLAEFSTQGCLLSKIAIFDKTVTLFQAKRFLTKEIDSLYKQGTSTRAFATNYSKFSFDRNNKTIQKIPVTKNIVSIGGNVFGKNVFCCTLYAGTKGGEIDVVHWDTVEKTDIIPLVMEPEQMIYTPKFILPDDSSLLCLKHDARTFLAQNEKYSSIPSSQLFRLVSIKLN